MLLIVGNGFDINLGLKTRYSDFINSLYGSNELSKTELFKYLIQRYNESGHKEELRWIDLENELKEYCLKEFYSLYNFNFNNSITLNRSSFNQEFDKLFDNIKTNKGYEKFRLRFEKEYNTLIEKLFDYINSQVETNVNVHSQAYLLIKKLSNKYNTVYINSAINPLSIINFNYTNKSILKKYFTIEKDNYVASLSETNFDAIRRNNVRLVEPNYYEIHGSLEEKNIILGIEGKFNLPDDFSFLKKGFRPNYSKNCNIERLVKENQTIIFFGFSFGETDSPYFRQFLGSYNADIDMYAPTEKGFGDKKVYIFHWGDLGYYQITNRINTLTDGNLDRFRQYNTVEFIDLKKFSPTIHTDYDKYF